MPFANDDHGDDDDDDKDGDDGRGNSTTKNIIKLSDT